MSVMFTYNIVNQTCSGWLCCAFLLKSTLLAFVNSNASIKHAVTLLFELTAIIGKVYSKVSVDVLLKKHTHTQNLISWHFEHSAIVWTSGKKVLLVTFIFFIHSF